MIWLRLHALFCLIIVKLKTNTSQSININYAEKKHRKIKKKTKNNTNQNQTNNQKKNPKRFYQKYLELRRRINAHSYPVSLPATLNTGIIGVNSTYTIAPTTSTATTTNNFTVQRSASLKDYKPLRYELLTIWHSSATIAKLLIIFIYYLFIIFISVLFKKKKLFLNFCFWYMESKLVILHTQTISELINSIKIITKFVEQALHIFEIKFREDVGSFIQLIQKKIKSFMRF